MKYSEYQEFVMSRAKPGEDIIRELHPDQAHMLHMAIGLIGEVVELEFSVDEENFREELGDIEFYLAGLIDSIDVIDNDGSRPHAPEVITEILYHTEDQAIRGLRYHAGEVLDRVKKLSVYQKAWYGADFQTPIDEVRAALWYLCHIRQSDCSMIRDENVEKLTERYPVGYSNKDAVERKDKNE